RRSCCPGALARFRSHRPGCTRAAPLVPGGGCVRAPPFDAQPEARRGRGGAAPRGGRAALWEAPPVFQAGAGGLGAARVRAGHRQGPGEGRAMKAQAPTETGRLTDGAACLEGALAYLRMGWSVLALCPPDHVGVGLVSRNHSKSCTCPGKRPWHTWRELQDRLATEDEVRRWWRQMPNSNVGVAYGPVSGLVGV